MFKKNKELKWLSLGALLLSVFGLIIAYISMSTALDIKEVNQFWKMDIVDVDVETTGNVTFTKFEVSSTSINNFDINFNGTGTAIYKFKVKNSGDVDAVLRVVNYGKPTCVSVDNNSCSKVSYKLTYADGRDVFTGDVVNSNTYMEMNLEVNYDGENNTEIMLKDLDFMMLYEQF